MEEENKYDLEQRAEKFLCRYVSFVLTIKHMINLQFTF